MRSLRLGPISFCVWLSAAIAYPTLAGQMPAAKHADSFSSCRQVFLPSSMSQFRPQRDYLIFVDRTVTLDPALVEKIAARAGHAVRVGDHIQIISFSSLDAMNYTTEEFRGDVEMPLTEDELSDEIPSRLVPLAQRCFSGYEKNAQDKIKREVKDLLAKPGTAAHSQIMLALSDMSQKFLLHNGRPKLVLIISDMLENSDVVSFYGDGKLEHLDVNRTMNIALGMHLVGNYANAKVFVAGAAAVPSGARERRVKERQQLYAFWQAWFENSKGQLPKENWGDPELVIDIE